MKNSVKFTASLIVLAFAPAFAMAGENCNQCGADTSETQFVINGQMQFGDTISNMNITAGEATEGTNGAATSAGNLISASNEVTNMHVESNQSLQANVGATSEVYVDYAHGVTSSTATAQGNAGQNVSLYGSNDNYIQQEALYGNQVNANSIISVDQGEYLVGNSQAAGNNWNTATANNFSQSQVGQYNSAEINSSSYVEANAVYGSAASGAVAAGNSHVISGENATIYSYLDQRNFSPVNADSVVNIAYANDVSSAANAVGNNASITNKFGYAEMTGYQENSSAVTGRSEVVLNGWEGTAVSGSSAMGNSALVSNIGSDAGIGVDQNNFGPVNSVANFFGGASTGGVGMATSFAAGNAVTGYSCAACGTSVKVNGSVNQANYASVTASTNIQAGTGGSLIGSATAVGNTATFIAQRSK